MSLRSESDSYSFSGSRSVSLSAQAGKSRTRAVRCAIDSGEKSAAPAACTGASTGSAEARLGGDPIVRFGSPPRSSAVRPRTARVVAADRRICCSSTIASWHATGKGWKVEARAAVVASGDFGVPFSMQAAVAAGCADQSNREVSA